MEKIKLQLSMIAGLLLLQSSHWESRIRYEIRFLLCGLFTYISVMILKPLGELFIGKESELLGFLFENPSFLIVAAFVIVLGYGGLYTSIIASSLFASLLRKT